MKKGRRVVKKPSAPEIDGREFLWRKRIWIYSYEEGEYWISSYSYEEREYWILLVQLILQFLFGKTKDAAKFNLFEEIFKRISSWNYESFKSKT